MGYIESNPDESIYDENEQEEAKLIYTFTLSEGQSEIEDLHVYLDNIVQALGLEIIKSTLESYGEVSEHDGQIKCRECGCDWFHACEGGCYWVEPDLCSKCNEKLRMAR